MTKPLDPEIKVLRAIGRGLQAAKALEPKARRRVFGWTSEKAYHEMKQATEAPPSDGERR